MKRIVINKNEVGMVVKNNVVKRVLTEGSYWLGFKETLNIYDMAESFNVNHDIDVLLTIPEFKALVEVVDVMDTEVCLVFVNNHFKFLLEAGRHVFWKGMNEYCFQIENMEHYEVPETISKAYLKAYVFKKYLSNFQVEVYQDALLFVNGEFVKELNTGEYFFWNKFNSINVRTVDSRIQQMEIQGQEILTKDKVQVRLNFNLQFKVVEIRKALIENVEYLNQLYGLMQMAIRSYVGNYTLDNLLENKDTLSQYVLSNNKEKAERLGLNLISAGVKDVILPGEIRDIMNQVLVAEKRAQANIITRREETASTRSLMNTAKLLEENAMLFRLKEMEYVEKIAEKINNISVSGNGQIVDQLKQLFLNK